MPGTLHTYGWCHHILNTTQPPQLSQRDIQTNKIIRDYHPLKDYQRVHVFISSIIHFYIGVVVSVKKLKTLAEGEQKEESVSDWLVQKG